MRKLHGVVELDRMSLAGLKRHLLVVDKLCVFDPDAVATELTVDIWRDYSREIVAELEVLKDRKLIRPLSHQYTYDVLAARSRNIADDPRHAPLYTRLMEYLQSHHRDFDSFWSLRNDLNTRQLANHIAATSQVETIPIWALRRNSTVYPKGQLLRVAAFG
jgi:hypothetical protein